jgi:hypothetical protein
MQHVDPGPSAATREPLDYPVSPVLRAHQLLLTGVAAYAIGEWQVRFPTPYATLAAVMQSTGFQECCRP